VLGPAADAVALSTAGAATGFIPHSQASDPARPTEIAVERATLDARSRFAVEARDRIWDQ
jgi:hypothetical protein